MYRAEIWSGTPHETLHGSDRFLPANAVHEERRKCCRPSGITDATCFFVAGSKKQTVQAKEHVSSEVIFMISPPADFIS